MRSCALTYIDRVSSKVVTSLQQLLREPRRLLLRQPEFPAQLAAHAALPLLDGAPRRRRAGSWRVAGGGSRLHET